MSEPGNSGLATNQHHEICFGTGINYLTDPQVLNDVRALEIPF